MLHCAIGNGQPACGTKAVIALFRIWSKARVDGTNALPAMVACARRHGANEPSQLEAAPQLAVAADSFFALTEACLGRALVRSERENALSGDEAALIATLRQVPVLEEIGPNRAVPHGLPGALQWAAFAVLRWVDVGEGAGVDAQYAVCPYSVPTIGTPSAPIA